MRIIQTILSLRLRASYVEPSGKISILETILNLIKFRNSTRDLFDKDANGNYTGFNSGIYKFDNNFYGESFAVQLSIYSKFYTVTLGWKAEPSRTYSKTIYGDVAGEPIERNVINFAPSARFQYNFNLEIYSTRLQWTNRINLPSVRCSQWKTTPIWWTKQSETQIWIGNLLWSWGMMVSLFNDKTFLPFNLGLMGSTTKRCLDLEQYLRWNRQAIHSNGKYKTEIPYNANLFSCTISRFEKFNFTTMHRRASISNMDILNM